MVEDDSVESVKFQVNPLHGDCDIYVSQATKFPDRDNYELKSQRIGSLVDNVVYNTSNERFDIAGDYYIGVYGYSFSTFTLIVTVFRQL